MIPTKDGKPIKQATVAVQSTGGGWDTWAEQLPDGETASPGLTHNILLLTARCDRQED